MVEPCGGLAIDGLETLEQELGADAEVVARVARRSGSMMFEESMLARAQSAVSAPAAPILHDITQRTRAARTHAPNEFDYTSFTICSAHFSHATHTNINRTPDLPLYEEISPPRAHPPPHTPHQCAVTAHYNT